MHGKTHSVLGFTKQSERLCILCRNAGAERHHIVSLNHTEGPIPAAVKDMLSRSPPLGDFLDHELNILSLCPQHHQHVHDELLCFDTVSGKREKT